MKRILRLSLTLLFAVLLVILSSYSASAANPYVPTADTVTDATDPTGNYGNDPFIQLSASNVPGPGCVETAYLWYKFNIPATAQTIGFAHLYLTTISAGTGTMDVELRSSPDTSWNENALTWDTPQPALDPTVLATAPGLTVNSTVVFSGTTFASYLDSHRGQTVTLVVRAHCAGAVGLLEALTVQTKENTNGSSVYLNLFTPTAVSLASLTGASTPLNSLGMVGLGAAVIVVLALLLLVRRRWHGA